MAKTTLPPMGFTPGEEELLQADLSVALQSFGGRQLAELKSQCRLII